MKKYRAYFTNFVLFVVFILTIIGANKYKLNKDIILAERTAQLFGMSEDNHLATRHSTSWQMYDNIIILFFTHYSLKSLAAKIEELGFEKLDYFDTRADYNFSELQTSNFSELQTSKLWIKNSKNKAIPNVTSWRLRERNKKIVEVDYIKIGEFGDEWVYRGREVGTKLIKITLQR